MKSRSVSNIFLVCLVTAVLTFIAFNGLKIQPLNINIPSASEAVRYGIDIRGGVRVVLEAEDAEDGTMPSPSDIDIVVGVLENRLDNQQIMDRSIIPQRDRGRVIVEIPRRSLDEDFDPEDQIEELGSMQMLEFWHVVPNTDGMDFNIEDLEGINPDALEGINPEDLEGLNLEDLEGMNPEDLVGTEQIEFDPVDDAGDINIEPETQTQEAQEFDSPDVETTMADILVEDVGEDVVDSEDVNELEETDAIETRENLEQEESDVQEDTADSDEAVEGIDIVDTQAPEATEEGVEIGISQEQQEGQEGITDMPEEMPQPEPFEKVELIISGTDVVNARPELDSQGSRYQVVLNLNAEGQRKFAEATGRLVGERIGIYLNDQFISAPSVESRIDSPNAVITLGTGGRRESLAEANRIANSINSGALPFTLTPIEINSITPVLGMSALDVMLSAAMFAILLVWIFMIVYYRLPGILACIALLLHVVIQVLFISWSGITLTLPGIAGVILTIGMGVDANIIIFERIKEELKIGKTLRAAIDVGFKKAIAAVLDANVTTFISGFILFLLGTGPVKSFAITLMLGVFLSFLTAITASRIMLKAVSRIEATKKRWFYGA